MISAYNSALQKSGFACKTLMRNVGSNTTAYYSAPPRDARVVICGGGVMGASVAYHLGKLGWGKETVLIEQNRWVW